MKESLNIGIIAGRILNTRQEGVKGSVQVYDIVDGANQPLAIYTDNGNPKSTTLIETDESGLFVWVFKWSPTQGGAYENATYRANGFVYQKMPDKGIGQKVGRARRQLYCLPNLMSFISANTSTPSNIVPDSDANKLLQMGIQKLITRAISKVMDNPSVPKSSPEQFGLLGLVTIVINH